jgi:DNA-binding CsgD family transcriptional regulator
MEVFFFMFGFYAIWGQVMVSSLIAPLVSPELLAKINELFFLLGSPFIIFAWLMLLRFSRELNGKTFSRFFTPVFITVNMAALLLIAIIPGRYPQLKIFDLLRFFFILSNFLYCGRVAIGFIKAGLISSVFSRKKFIFIALILLAFMLAQNSLLLIYTAELWQSLAFIFLYFLSASFLPVYINYQAELSLNADADIPVPSFEEFCSSFEISPREREIIREICLGLSNQEIANKLYISLQTVKDHTHRIYSKVDVRSRMQLMKLVGKTH